MSFHTVEARECQRARHLLGDLPSCPLLSEGVTPVPLPVVTFYTAGGPGATLEGGKLRPSKATQSARGPRTCLQWRSNPLISSKAAPRPLLSPCLRRRALWAGQGFSGSALRGSHGCVRGDVLGAGPPASLRSSLDQNGAERNCGQWEREGCGDLPVVRALLSRWRMAGRRWTPGCPQVACAQAPAVLHIWSHPVPEPGSSPLTAFCST